MAGLRVLTLKHCFYVSILISSLRSNSGSEKVHAAIIRINCRKAFALPTCTLYMKSVPSGCKSNCKITRSGNLLRATCYQPICVKASWGQDKNLGMVKMLWIGQSAYSFPIWKQCQRLNGCRFASKCGLKLQSIPCVKMQGIRARIQISMLFSTATSNNFSEFRPF